MFESCSAYQTFPTPEILFISHCVPNPPDKGDRIRAYHQLAWLAGRFRIHLVCFARSEAERRYALELRDRCASVHAEPLYSKRALLRSAVLFAGGRSLTTSYYHAPAAQAHIRELVRSRPLSATFCYSSAVAPLAPEEFPLVLDFVDMDSEKWLHYGRMRWPGWAYRLEGYRLRNLERRWALRSHQCYVSTEQELNLLRRAAPESKADAVENGVDFDYFDPARTYFNTQTPGRNFLVFTGVMNYYPNAQGIISFATRIFPELRRAVPGLELFVVGRNPTRAVRELQSEPGVTVTGAVPDVRPYLAGASGVVVPLEIARGIQNKVLEALAMGKSAYCSPAVRATFGPAAPEGVVLCANTEDYLKAILSRPSTIPGWQPKIRESAQHRFCWTRNLSRMTSAFEALMPKAAGSNA